MIRGFRAVGLLAVALALVQSGPRADAASQGLPFAQSWTNIAQIALNDNWDGVPGVVGYRGDDATTLTGTDPQTLLGDYTNTPIDVNANQTNPNSFTTGGVAEFELADPTIALNGSGTADAPFVLINVRTTGYTNINVAYRLRDIDSSADNAAQPVALHYRIGTTGSFVNVPAAFVSDATAGPSLTLVTDVSTVLPAEANDQPLVQLRVMSTNAVGNDEWVGIDDILVTGATTNPTATGLANPASVPVGGSTLLTVTVVAGVTPDSTGLGVTTDLSAIGGLVNAIFLDDGVLPDGSANDLIFSFGATVPAGTAVGAKSLPVTVRDDQLRTATTSILLTVAEPPPPPPPLYTIAEIQGTGPLSSLVGLRLRTTGVVTAQRFNNGFFVQTPDDAVDDNAATSEGLFVFTGSGGIPPAAAVGNLVDVVGTVAEFIPTTDPGSPPQTELVSATVTELATGQGLPTPILLSAADTQPAGGLDQLERFEGMRVRVASMTVTQATQGSITEPTGVVASNGVFGAVVTGVARPFREPGIERPDALPAGTPATVARFDANPERLAVDSNGQVGPATTVEVAAGDLVANVVGPLDFATRTYTILQDPTSAIVVTRRASPAPVRAPRADELTVASFNVQRFFDDVDAAGIAEPVLTPAVFAARLAKASLIVRTVLHSPDIVGLQEVENLSTLQALADRVNADAVAGGESSPGYAAFLEEGNDIGGIDVGFLVKASRVSVVGVVQEGRTTTFTNPNTGASELLNDRPPLVLRATAPRPGGAPFPITVIVNHLRSLNGVDDPTDGRVRSKRRAQAEYLAGLIQARQTADPGERIISIGDYNAFEFNDGYVDVIGTVKGQPAAPGDVTLASADLVNPDLVDLVDLVPTADRYSYVFRGSAQVLDHALVGQALAPYLSEDGVQFGRTDADFPETHRTNPLTPSARLSDHDPLVAYFTLPAPASTTTAISASRNPSAFGQPVTFTALVTAHGAPVADGTILFEEAGAGLAAPVPLGADGRASLTLSTLVLGQRVVSAAYSGADDFEPSSGNMTHSVVPGLRVTDVSIVEGDTGTIGATFAVTLSAIASQVVSVNVQTSGGTATAGLDYVPLPSTALTFAPGVDSQTVMVAVAGDRLSEAAETFGVLLSGASNALVEDGQGVGTIVDNDSLPGLFVSDTVVVEGASGTRNAVFSVRLSRASGQEVKVDVSTADDTALAASDYVTTAGTLAFPVGTLQRTVMVPVRGDRIAEDNQTFFVDLSNPIGAQLADPRGRATILNDDFAFVSIGDATGPEPMAGTADFLFTVQLSNPSEHDVRVSYSTANLTARGGVDYIAVPVSPPSTLVIPAGAVSRTIAIRVLADADTERPEAFLVILRRAEHAFLQDAVGVATIH